MSLRHRLLKRSTTALALTCLAAGCGGENEQSGAGSGSTPKVGDPGPIHVHGLGVNPQDGALFIATHTGLFRAAEGEERAKRVAGRYQDTMGFSVVGRDRFLGSGHPDGREGLPPFLGLIESRDAGENWRPVSLQGKRDFHVLEASGSRIYGFGSDFESREADLLVSDDGGRRWVRRPTPEGLLSLAIDPGDRDHVIVSGEKQMYESRDAGRSWRPVGDGDPAMVAWPVRERLFAVANSGAVSLSSDGGREWQEVGQVGGQPAAFESVSARELYVALHNGRVKRSLDAGASWSVRSAP